MKLTKQELQEIIKELEKGSTLCLPQSISLKEYKKIIKQIESFAARKDFELWNQLKKILFLIF